MTPADLAAARREAEEALVAWTTCSRQHEDACFCGAWPMEEALRSLLAASEPAPALPDEIREAAERAVSTLRSGAHHLLAMSGGAHHCPGCGLIHAEWVDAAVKLETALASRGGRS